MSSPSVACPLAGGVLGSPGGSFAIAEWQDAGGPAGPPRLIAPLHVHHKDDEAWYVLEGTVCVRCGDNTVEAQAGAGILVPKGMPHTDWNPGPGRLRYLLIMTANIHQLVQDIHAMPERTPAALRAMFQKHDSELLEI